MDKSSNKTLKDICRERFINNVIKATLESSGGKGLILILDDHTSRVLDSFASVSELIAAGVTTIENIKRQRKSFPSFRGLYFVEPTKSNVELIDNEFTKDKSLYHSRHLFTSRGLSDDCFQFLASRSFSKHLTSLKEVNMDFFVAGDSLFRVPAATSLELQGDALLSLLASLQQVNSVEVFRPKTPAIGDAATLQKFIDPKIKSLLPHLSPTTGEGTSVRIFIIERATDLVTPLMHDFYFESLIADLLDDSITIYADPDQPAKDKTQRIEDADRLYRKFRFEFVQIVKDGLPLELERFKKENPTAVAQQNRQNEMEIAQMQNAIRGLNEYTDFTRFYKLSVDAVKRILDISKADGLQALGELELTVATAINEVNEKVDAKYRVEDLRKFLSSNAKEALKLRLALIALGTLYIDVSGLRALLSPASQKIFDKYTALVTKYGKLVPEYLKDVYRDLVKERFKKSKSSLQRYISRTDYLVSRCLFENISEDLERLSYDQLGYRSAPSKPTSGNTAFKLKIGPPKVNGGHTTVIAYFVGGISYAEIVSLMRFENQPGARLKMLIGSNAVYNPNGFVEQFVNKS